MGFFSIHGIQSATKIVINEINVMDPSELDKSDYIELKQISRTVEPLPLRGYKLIGFTCKSNTGIIDTVFTLWNVRMNKHGLFTIGGPLVTTADMNTPHEMVKTQSSFTKLKLTKITNFVNNPTAEIRAFGLLYDAGNSFSNIALTNNQKFLKIDEKITDLLTKYLVDLVVYTGRTCCDKCDFIEKIHSDYSGRKYVLRDLMMNLKNNDVSLNRCAIESTAFLPEMFKLGDPTPGAENDCNGPRFILEELIEEARDDRIVPYCVSDDELEDDCRDRAGPVYSSETENSEHICLAQYQPGCSSSIALSDYVQTTSYSIAQTILHQNASAIKDSCTSLLLSPYGDASGTTVERENLRKRSIGVDADYSTDQEWSTTKYFK